MTIPTSAQSATAATNKSLTPKGLGERGARKWYELSEQVIQEPKNLELLTLACGAWEDWVQASEQITGSGVIDGTGGTQKSHPAVERKREAAKLYRQLLKDIAWVTASDEDGLGSRPDTVDD